jgi:hypothetical protein
MPDPIAPKPTKPIRFAPATSVSAAMIAEHRGRAQTRRKPWVESTTGAASPAVVEMAESGRDDFRGMALSRLCQCDFAARTLVRAEARLRPATGSGIPNDMVIK